jgi:hypothetical protein
MSSVVMDLSVLTGRLELLSSHSVGSLFLSEKLSKTTRNIIFSTTGKSGTVILLSVEDIKKIIELLEVICE